MRAYALSRLAQTVLVVFLSLTAVFMMVRLSGDPVLLFMPMDIQAKDVNEFRQRLGLHDPRPVHEAPLLLRAGSPAWSCPRSCSPRSSPRGSPGSRARPSSTSWARNTS